MQVTFTEMDSIFNRTKDALLQFMEIITPIIENTQDDHERLYWHHIYEEEEHRSDRLDILLPKIQKLIKGEENISSNQFEFVHLLQDISLEKFGLHNFLEHLDLSLFQFKETEFEERIQALRDLTYNDYQQMKLILETLNQEFQGGAVLDTSVPTDEKEGKNSNLKMDIYSNDHSHEQNQSHERNQSKQSLKKTLTVGSLKQR